LLLLGSPKKNPFDGDIVEVVIPERAVGNLSVVNYVRVKRRFVDCISVMERTMFNQRIVGKREVHVAVTRVARTRNIALSEKTCFPKSV
jgi:hypothetical protein